MFKFPYLAVTRLNSPTHATAKWIAISMGAIHLTNFRLVSLGKVVHLKGGPVFFSKFFQLDWVLYRNFRKFWLNGSRPIPHPTVWVITRASVGKPESENATVFPAKRGVMVPGVPCIDRGNWGRETRHCSFVTKFGVLKVLASIAPYTFISHTKMSISFRKGRSSNYILQSQPGKLILETISSDNNWADLLLFHIYNVAVKQIILQ